MHLSRLFYDRLFKRGIYYFKNTVSYAFISMIRVHWIERKISPVLTSECDSMPESQYFMHTNTGISVLFCYLSTY
jgi:hypothetical protein